MSRGRASLFAEINRRLKTAVASGDYGAAAAIACEYDDVPPPEPADERSGYQRALETAVDDPPKFVGARLVCGVCDAVVARVLTDTTTVLFSSEWADPEVQTTMTASEDDGQRTPKRRRRATSTCHVLLSPEIADRDSLRPAVARCADHGWLYVDEGRALTEACLGFSRQRYVRLPLGTR